MKRWLKILSLTVLLALGGWIGQRWANRPAPPAAGPIVLPDGSWAYIEAATFGTNHLVGPPLSHAAQHLPASLRGALVRSIGRPAMMRFTHTTSEPKLVLWLNRGLATAFPTNLGYFECVLSDTNGFTSGEKVHFAARYPLTVTEFSVFPRRSPEITLSIFHHDATGSVVKRGSVAFANPAYRRFSEWQPEPLPATRRTSNVMATMLEFRVGAEADLVQKLQGGGKLGTVFGPSAPEHANAVFCSLHLLPLPNTNAVWRVSYAETSDATGNRIENNLIDLEQMGARGWFQFSPALWPDETWKVKCELRCTEQVSPERRFSFYKVPLGALNKTNHIGWTTDCRGVKVTLRDVVRQAPPTHRSAWVQNSLSRLEFEVSGQTNDLRLACLAARTEEGADLTNGTWSHEPDAHTYLVDLPTSAVTADFTFILQRSCWVEFQAKPQR